MVNHCIICGNEAEIHNSQRFDGIFINCEHCGKLVIEDDTKLTIKKKSCILRFINDGVYKNYVLRFYEDLHEINSFSSDHQYYNVNIKSLINLYPQNLSEKIDLILLNIESRIKYIGNEFIANFFYDENNPYADFFVDDSYGDKTINVQFRGEIGILRELGYLKEGRNLGDDRMGYTLTAKGWARVSTLHLVQIKLPQAFIAMSFDPKLDKARDTIIKSITDCGYSPMIISLKEHNNQIVPEIFYEIKRSQFVIADLTMQRNGVYYEAGYAEALEKPVILTCNKQDFDKRHFDVSQKNTIQWESEEDLYKRLTKRVEVTVGKI